MIDVELPESAVVEALRKTEVFALVEPYQGDIDDALKGLLIMPAALVVYGGADPEGAQVNLDVRAKVRVAFSVFYIAKNLRGNKEASSDVRKLLKKGREALNGLVVEDRTLVWQTERLQVVMKNGVCAYEQIYQYTDWLIAQKKTA